MIRPLGIMESTSLVNKTYGLLHEDNATSSIYGSYAERQINSGVTMFASAVGLLGNTAVLVAILTFKKLQTTTNVFVFNLSLADVLTCMVAPLQAVTILNDEPVFPLWICQVVAFGLVTCIGCSVNTLACIAVNRLVGVTTALQSPYRKLHKPRYLALSVALSWCIPIAVALLPFVTDYAEYGYNSTFNSCTWRSNRSYAFIFSMLIALMFFPVQLVIITISYFRIFLYTRKTTRSTLNQDTVGNVDTGNKILQHQLWKRQVAVTKNLFLVLCVFLICISPYFVMLGVGTIRLPSLLTYASTILMANSSVNPIIYGTKHPDFRKAFARLFCNCKNMSMQFCRIKRRGK